MSILNEIVEKKRGRLVYAKSGAPLAELKSIIREIAGPADFGESIKRGSGDVKLIAEIKKASPSRGLIKGDFDHIGIASLYKSKKVDAISVITEEDFFQGRLVFLSDVKKTANIPVLRKDFIFDEYQIYEARANMADAVLLIASILDTAQADEYLHLTRELGMSALFEVHDYAELEKALDINAPIIGINNRNLKTLDIDINTTLELKKEIPDDRTIVGESGIRTRDDVLMMNDAGVDAMIIGTTLMESLDIGKKIDELRGLL